MKISISEEDLAILEEPQPKQATTLQEAEAMKKLALIMDSLGESASARVLRWGMERCKDGLLTQAKLLKKQATVTSSLLEQFRQAEQELQNQPVNILAPSPKL